MSHTRLKLAVVSNFLALEIRDALDVWFKTLDVEPVLSFGPYDSVIQQLLDPKGSCVDCDLAVILLQIERWCKPPEGLSNSATAENLETFVKAVGFAAVDSPTRRLLVISCPISPHSHASNTVMLLEDHLRESFWGFHNLDFLGARERDAYYPLQDHSEYFVDTAFADDIAVSYSQLCFATLGTMVARCIHKWFKEPRKAIVVDCDNTLWSGICGESGTDSVNIGEGNRMLQEILVRQSNRGQLVCLCSKNDEPDVFAIFDHHPGMVLGRNNLTTHRINWRPKADNLQSLSEELCLGLDQFIFVDDDPFECESVRALCPAVRTIQVPPDQSEFSRILLQVWDFDKASVTAEDASRTLYYKQNAERDRALRTALTLNDFLESLNLRVDILPLRLQETVRVSQLLRRVTQFNLNGIQKSVSELVSLIGETPCYTVRAADRFGDYGLVGAIVYRNVAGVLHVETLALSCRSLGRGVERHLATHFAEMGHSSGSVKALVRGTRYAEKRAAEDFPQRPGMRGEWARSVRGHG